MSNPNITTIEPLTVGGLSGRVLRAEQAGVKPKPILLVYGIHSSLERMNSMAEFLSDYGQVVLPDLPGIGGMDSFYKVGLSPSFDAYADYLYAFLRLNHSTDRQPITVVGMSFGFLVVTSMLQKYPQSRPWIKTVISFVGFGSSQDFKAYRNPLNRYISRLFSTRAGSWLVSHLVFNPVSLRLMFGIFRWFNPKYRYALATNRDQSQAMELDLWQKNDARTRFALYDLLLDFDLTRHQPAIELDLHDVTTPTDQYFDHDRVAKSLQRLYRRVSRSPANMALHAPSIIGDKQEVANIFSDEVKALLDS